MSGPLRLLLLGASGSIGQATARELIARGHELVCPVRDAALRCPGAELLTGVLDDDAALQRLVARRPGWDAVISCIASRTGVAADAWAVDHGLNARVLRAAQRAGVPQFLLLSAICVQKPRLAFQQAKLAFERELMASGLRYTIVRPTAFFKSLSGQVARVRRGQPYLLFGDGRGTACKPISDADLARYLADCLTDPARHQRVLPIGGPGQATTPREQGEALFALLGRPPRFRAVPPRLLGAIAGGLDLAARLVPPLVAKAELARIGQYYATESMLVWDAARGRYDADATPSTGSDTLIEHHAALLRGELSLDRGAHAVF